MQNKPISIRKGRAEDLPSLLALYRDAIEDSSPKGHHGFDERSIDEKDISSVIEDGRLYVLVEGKAILGAASVSHDVAEAFFPESHSYRKSEDLLERISYRGEPIAILERFLISPDRQKEGLGSEFLQSLLARYKGSTWIFAVKESNTSALSFFLHRGFSSLGPYPDLEGSGENARCIVYRIHKREGLCSTAWW